MVVTSKKSNFKPVKRRTVGRRTTNKKKIGQISSCTSKQHPAIAKSVEVPKELLSRFPSALKEINRRLMGQNMMWLALYSWRRETFRVLPRKFPQIKLTENSSPNARGNHSLNPLERKWREYGSNGALDTWNTKYEGLLWDVNKSP